MTATLRPGPHDPVADTPPRAPRSARRTMSLDMTRPDGLFGPLVADIRGQDVVTDGDGQGSVVDRLHVALHIDQRTREIVEVEEVAVSRPLPDLAGSASGIGRRLADVYPEEHAARALLCSALEDLGGALLVAGYALLYAGAIPGSREFADERARRQADICAGWATGTPLLESLRVDGVAALPIGPAAPTIEDADPLGWHAMAPMATTTVRRRRRLDVTAGDGERRRLESHFRDSFAGPDGEQVMHEYQLEATVVGGIVEGLTVEPRVLPWYECPGAVASAQQVVGVALADLPGRVRADLVGAHTCTHLNSTLRCLADACAL
jgi:hypothetical protein